MTRLQELVKNIPVFPLPDLVLFPHSMTPLRIFEPRYIKLFTDVILGSKFLVIVQIKPGYEEEYFEAPPFYEFGCLCYVRETRVTDNNQLVVLVKGIARVKLKQELASSLYRNGEFELILEKKLLQSANSLGIIHRELWKIYTIVVEYLPDHGERLNSIIKKEYPPWTLANLIADNIILDIRVKRKIAQMQNPLNRMNYMINLLQEYMEAAHYLRGGRKETPEEPWLN